MSAQSLKLSEIWEAVRLGNQQSFSTFHRLLYPELFRYAKGLLKDDVVAEDLIQDFFVKLWVKKEQIGSIANVKGYTYQAVRCMCFNFLKSAKIGQSNLCAMPWEDFELSIEDSITQDESDLFIKEKVQRALNDLTERQREIVYLRFFEKLDYDQIVRITGVKYQSVINHIYRAIQVLRDKLKVNVDPVLVRVL